MLPWNRELNIWICSQTAELNRHWDDLWAKNMFICVLHVMMNYTHIQYDFKWYSTEEEINTGLYIWHMLTHVIIRTYHQNSADSSNFSLYTSSTLTKSFTFFWYQTARTFRIKIDPFKRKLRLIWKPISAKKQFNEYLLG